jgi:hypothetical protein
MISYFRILKFETRLCLITVATLCSTTSLALHTVMAITFVNSDSNDGFTLNDIKGKQSNHKANMKIVCFEAIHRW